MCGAKLQFKGLLVKKEFHRGHRRKDQEVSIPEKLARDVENLIKDRPELAFKNVDEFIVNAVSLFLGRKAFKSEDVK